MIAITKPIHRPFAWPRLRLPFTSPEARRRKRATIDLIHSSAYLRQDIGLLEEHFSKRHR